MRIDLGGARPARPVDDVDLSSVTTAKRTGRAKWVPGQWGVLDMPFDRDLSADEVAAVVRLLTSASNEAAQSRSDVEAWLQVTNPNLVQNTVALRAVARLMLDLLDRAGEA